MLHPMNFGIFDDAVRERLLDEPAANHERARRTATIRLVPLNRDFEYSWPGIAGPGEAHVPRITRSHAATCAAASSRESSQASRGASDCGLIPGAVRIFSPRS